MTYFATSDELENLLVEFFRAFLGSDAAKQAAEASAQLDRAAVLQLRTVDPEAEVAVDFGARTVAATVADQPAATIEVEADSLHDLLLDRLDPVQISRLYETHRLRPTGHWASLGALVALLAPLQPFYPETITRLGRADLLETPMPSTGEVWTSELPPEQLIGTRRPWQQKKTRAAAA